jgi:predicted GIY-YIG superfamily endonuclease
MIFTPVKDSSILTWRGLSVLLDPPRYFYVYLIHFHQKIGNPAQPRGMAGHYLGACQDIDVRISRHRTGDGARIMQVVTQAGIPWELVRLWRVSSWEESRDLEKKLKAWHASNKLCYLCNPRLEVDPLVKRRQGHPTFSTWQGKRQPMSVK